MDSGAWSGDMASELSWQSRIWRRVWGRVTARVDQYASPEAMQAAQRRGLGLPVLARGVKMQTIDAGGVPAEWLTPAAASDAVLLYIHGGAWTLGWNPAHRWLVSHLARATACRTLALDYRLAPQHSFPAALDDCLAAYRWLRANGTRPERIVIGGDSAGGNLTLSTMLALRESGEPLPAAGVCLSPVTDLAGEAEDDPQTTQIAQKDHPQIAPPHYARDEYEIAQIEETDLGKPAGALAPNVGRLRPDDDAGLPVGWAQEQLRLYLGDTDPRLPLVSPYYADLNGLPPLLIQVGGAEYLRHDVRRFVPRARAAGVDVTLQVYPGMWHVWQILVGLMPEANRAVAGIGDFVHSALEGNTSATGGV